MKKFFLIALITISGFVAVHAGPYHIQSELLLPGLKLGYTLGKNGGFTWGFELSYILYIPHNHNYFSVDYVCPGIVLDIDFCKHFTKFNLSGELITVFPTTQSHLLTLPLGISIGPSLISNCTDIDVGVSFIPFFGLLAYPYYEYTFRPYKEDLHGVGSYLKYPIVRGVL